MTRHVKKSPASFFFSENVPLMLHEKSHLAVQPIAFGVSFNLNLQSQPHWSLFNGTWQKRLIETDHRLRFEI